VGKKDAIATNVFKTMCSKRHLSASKVF